MRGIGGSESRSKHMEPRAYERRRVRCGVPECGGRRIAARGDERRDPRPARTGRGSAVDAAPGGRAARAAVTSTGAAGCRASAAETRPARAPPRALRPVAGIDTKVLRPARPWPQPSRIRALQSRAGVTKPCGRYKAVRYLVPAVTPRPPATFIGRRMGDGTRAPEGHN